MSAPPAESLAKGSISLTESHTKTYSLVSPLSLAAMPLAAYTLYLPLIFAWILLTSQMIIQNSTRHLHSMLLLGRASGPAPVSIAVWNTNRGSDEAKLSSYV